MAKKAFLGRLILRDRILDDGAVIIENGSITYVGTRADAILPANITDVGQNYIAPGFVDIHNHLTMQVHDDMDAILALSQYHLNNGTTGMLYTLYRDVPYKKVMRIIPSFKDLMEKHPHFLGIHLEGPYLNPAYGSAESESTSHIPNQSEYESIIDTGLVKQWTFAPEVPGTREFLSALTRAGIAPAIGHSAASPDDVLYAAEHGAKIVTHVFNATGSSETKSRGISPVTFDDAALLADTLYYEVICDKNAIHVPHELVRLLIKTVGVSRVIAITDFCGMPNGDSDVRYAENGDLAGSCMTMRQAAQNFLRVGRSLPDVFCMTAYNPAKAIGMQDLLGSLAVGKKANLLTINADLTEMSVYLAGNKIS